MRSTVSAWRRNAGLAGNECLSSETRQPAAPHEQRTVPAQESRSAVLVAARDRLERLRNRAVPGRDHVRQGHHLAEVHFHRCGLRIPSQRSAALPVPLPANLATWTDDRRRTSECVCRRADLANDRQLGVRELRGTRSADAALVRVPDRRDDCDLSIGVLDGPVLRLQVLRVHAGRTGARAARRGAGSGGPAQDAALSIESPLPVQHAQCDLHPHHRQSQLGGELCRVWLVGIPALHARSGSDEESHGGAGARGAEPVPEHREDALRFAIDHHR